jgi:predicted RNase H-like HicB family nuclease
VVEIEAGCNEQRMRMLGMKYKVVLKKSKEGYSASCPSLPGCWSQGKTEKEALSNIQEAIGEYLEALAKTEVKNNSSCVSS